VDPETDGDVFRFAESMEKGDFLKRGEDSIVLGSWLAEDLQADIGFPVSLLTRSRDGYYQTIDLDVAGIFNCPNPYVNRATALIPLDTADYYLQMEGAVTEIALSLPESAGLREEIAAVNQVLQSESKNLESKGIEVYTWQELAYDYLQFAAAKQGGSKIILFLVFIIAAVGISNTMLMAVYERIRELGMMRALGMDDGKLRAAFILEAGGIGFFGSVFGVLIGSIATWYFVRYGIDFTFMTREMDMGYRVAGVMYGTWNIGTMVTAFIAGIVISMIIAIFPTRKVVRMQVADALHHQ
jgi:ABC-type lipoprotein release transport system permease subunit